MYRIVRLLRCAPKANLILYVNCTSKLKEKDTHAHNAEHVDNIHYA